ncbi:hypothetical protein GAYE_SCF37G5124 [Galdieria yellowstonensis]|uniref:RING-type domain-containing protein n=1 Tax=Galdieria yellowstonensis TaxID=3028027 RepID=A0AAV9IID6_9RHOD|nr:hypothetical protein GAYE_SCF37G5124 [Galdieria yellowstonensis]
MERKTSTIIGDEICAVCLDLSATVELHPCYHRVICRKCVCRLDDRKCPICRMEISNVLIRGFEHICSEEWFEDKPNATREANCNDLSQKIQEQCKPQLPGSNDFVTTFVTYNDPKESTEAYSLSFESILKRRRAHEELIKKHAYQVVITGSQGVDTPGLVSELRKLFPLKHDFRTAQRSLWQQAQSLQSNGNEIFTRLLTGGNSVFSVKIDQLVDIFHSTEVYFPNLEVNSIPINLRRLSIWELLYNLRTVMGGSFDVMMLCCDARCKKSFEELLSLDELLRNRYAPGKNRIWVVLHFNERSTDENFLSSDQVSRAFYQIPMNQRPCDLIFMRQKALCNFWHREMMQRMVHHARNYRKLTRLGNAEAGKNSTCCSM